MAKRKRKYTHKEDRIMPVEHGSVADDIDHMYGGSGIGPYKTKRKKKSWL